MKSTSVRRGLAALAAAVGLMGSPALAGVPHEMVWALGGPESVEPDLLELKFKEDHRIRLREGRPTDLEGRALRDARARALLKRVEAGQWMRSHEVAEDVLERLQAEGEWNSRQALPDLNLYFRLRLPPGLDADALAEAFRALPEVEAVYRAPRPAPAPVAPDYYTPTSTRPYQRYQDAAPGGIDSRFAATLAGARGTGVRICNIEYSYNPSHVDLGTVTLVGAAWEDPFNNTNHGTAVLGVLGGTSNTEGVTGIAHAASKLFAAARTASGYNVGSAVTTCAANINAGDVILIEQQIAGPNGSTAYVPPEWYKPWYDAIRTAVAANKLVVETAGNGSQNLDDPIYSTGNGGHYPFLAANDSGAYLIGGGMSPAYGTSARSAHGYSNHGSTLDLQGWGDSVVTAGYGDLYSAEGVNRYFTADFGGTSSAAPIVAGAAASLQGRYRLLRGSTLTPASVKALLRAHGTAQTGSRNIGPLPNLRNALSSIIACQGSTPAGNTAWQQYSPDGLYVDVNTSACGYTSAPLYFTSLGGYGNHWVVKGATSIYAPTATGFRVYIRFPGSITPTQANQSGWHINWQATPNNLRQEDLCTGRTVQGATAWQQYGTDGVYLEVDTSGCALAFTPLYLTSLGGISSHWTTTGATSIYVPTARGFGVFVAMPGITPALANEWGWHLNWQATPNGQRATFACSGQTSQGATAWQQHSADGIYVDVSASGCGLSGTPQYFASLGGTSSHWVAQGATSIYSPTATGFRVYVNSPGITPALANQYSWHINWNRR